MIKLNFPTYLVKIIHQYLDNRTFNVKTIVPPQVFVASPRERLKGSILSPAIYNLCTSDFPPLHQSPSASLPTMPPYNSITADQAVRTSQAYLSQFETWLTKWRIAINTDKTNAIIFKKRRAQTMPTQLKLFEERINWTFETSYLGLILNDNLPTDRTSMK
ncbi:RNA-directed DNA polymerase from mobile element jockey [Trichonephila clavipes]|nr:RNA-directed DNA polymerase from mobile element jockey [Trichonephila clavipes]